MTLGERLLELSAEYARSKHVREAWDGDAGREPVVIAAEYEDALRELLTK